jgi:hypothetical protein
MCEDEKVGGCPNKKRSKKAINPPLTLFNMDMKIARNQLWVIAHIAMWNLTMQMASGFELKLTMRGDLYEGLYVPSMIDLTTGKRYILKRQSKDPNKSTWFFGGARPERKCAVIIEDHHPSITSSCIYAEEINVTKDNQDLSVDLGGKAIKIILKIDKESHLLSYFPTNPRTVLGRLRRIDKMGLVSVWIFLEKSADSEYVAELVNFQQGEYLLDLFSKHEKVVNGDPNLGYAEWTKKIKLTTNDLSVTY